MAAEQIIAGVVLSERLAVTMYGAIHRAQHNGARNLRGLVVDPKMLAEGSFRLALTNSSEIQTAITLDHPAIVPTVAVEMGGPDVVVVTRGVGRYVTVHDLISSAKATRQGGKLPLPVAAMIGRSVVEALASAHAAGVVHGAVHPRSVLVDETGDVRLSDFVVGRALTTAVAQGADSALWRGLAGFLAPELVVGEDPTPAADVFAVGAMLFTMLTGDVPPGPLHVTPAVERLVQRALDTDVLRRYRNAGDLLENLLEAFEDDRLDVADPAELIRAAGLSRADSNLDEATEDLLASLGNNAVQVTPTRPSMDIRVEAAVSSGGKNRLDALLADLDDARELTAVEDRPFKHDPISELIHMDPRKREAIVQIKRVPSLDDPDDTPIPSPRRDSEPDVDRNRNRSSSSDEAAALDAISGLDAPMRRVSSAAEQVTVAAEKLEAAAARAERAAESIDTGQQDIVDNRAERARPGPRIARPIADVPDFHVDPPKLKSPMRTVVGLIAVLAIIGGVVGVYLGYRRNEDNISEHDRLVQEQESALRDRERRALDAQADSGRLSISSNPGQAGAWLELGHAAFDTPFPLTSSQMHEIRVELAGYQSVDTQILPTHWTGGGTQRKASITVVLKPLDKDKKGKLVEVKLGPTPVKPPDITGYTAGEGPLHVETEPKGAEVWLYMGVTGAVNYPVVAGRNYQVRVLKDGYLPAFASITPDEWRDKGDDPHRPIDEAKKKAVIEKTIELQPDPEAAGSGAKKPPR